VASGATIGPVDSALSAATVRRVLVVASALVCLVGLLAELARHLLEYDHPVLSLLSLSYEGNLPTWYASALPLVCAALLAWISSTEPTDRRHWRALALGFLLISIDEVIGLHEHLSPLIATEGLLHFGWVIPAGVLVVVLFFTFLGFLRRLSRETARVFLLAGALYVLGAVAGDLPLGWWTATHGDENLGYALIDWCEETLEFVGLTLFASALLDRLGGRGVRVTPRLAAPTR
jgi:hypothetical protein